MTRVMDRSMPICGVCNLLFLVLFATSGCRTPLSPRAIDASRIYDSPKLYDDELQIQRGQRRPVIDAIGWTIGIPSKILLWDRRVENHNVSLETEAAISDYLSANQLYSVRVRLNQYHPLEDWRRLRKNTSVGVPWRYTLGVFSVLGEALIPGRVFGGDHYNPFTNTVHLYSDVPAIALHEAGHAKDFARRRWKGSYAAVYLLPIVPLYHESVASSDVIAYLNASGSVAERAEAARILYPAYGTYAGSAAGTLLPIYSDPLYVSGVLIGHATGRVQAHRIKADQADMAEQQTDTSISIPRAEPLFAP